MWQKIKNNKTIRYMISRLLEELIVYISLVVFVMIAFFIVVPFIALLVSKLPN